MEADKPLEEERESQDQQSLSEEQQPQLTSKHRKPEDALFV